MLRSPGAMSIVRAVSPSASPKCAATLPSVTQNAREVERSIGHPASSRGPCSVSRPSPISTGYSPEAAPAHKQARARQAAQDAQRRRERGEPPDRPGAHHGLGEPLVERAALREQRSERGAVARQRALAAAAVARHALPRGVGVDVEQHGRLRCAARSWTRSERTRRRRARSPPRPARGRAARSTSRLLGRAERRLAGARELLGDGMPELARPGASSLSCAFWPSAVGELAGGRRLAGAHEADQDDCHPIRSR